MQVTTHQVLIDMQATPDMQQSDLIMLPITQETGWLETFSELQSGHPEKRRESNVELVSWRLLTSSSKLEHSRRRCKLKPSDQDAGVQCTAEEQPTRNLYTRAAMCTLLSGGAKCVANAFATCLAGSHLNQVLDEADTPPGFHAT